MAKILSAKELNEIMLDCMETGVGEAMWNWYEDVMAQADPSYVKKPCPEGYRVEIPTFVLNEDSPMAMAIKPLAEAKYGKDKNSFYSRNVKKAKRKKTPDAHL